MSNGSMDGMPNVVAVATASNYGRFAVGPLEVGIGVTLGNALRRILLSSLPGSAITSVRIQNVFHEFSCIPNVQEDVTGIVMNIKNIRLRSYSERSVRLQLNKYGAGEVRAGDIELPANVELVNPGQVLATLDGPDAHLEMELTVERGRGYVSFEAREGLQIGTIPVDAVFSPIPKVNYLVQPAGEELLVVPSEDSNKQPLTPTDLEGREQLVIEIWTDGTIDPGEALSIAAQYLAQHSSLISNFNRTVAPVLGRDLLTAAIPPHLFDMSIEDLGLSMRTYNCLKRSGIMKVGQVLRMDRKELLGLRNFGEKSFDELLESLSSRDLIPPGTPLAEPAEEQDEDQEAADAEARLDSAEIGYPDYDTEEPEPDAFVLEPVMGPSPEDVVVANLAGESQGSAEMAAGIYLDGEPASGEVDLSTETPPTAGVHSKQPEDVIAATEELAEVEEATAAKSKSRKKK